MASILIIDDDTGIRRVVRTSLERAGHGVVEAENGVVGMALYREEPADVVITDLFMPDQDGIETIQQLREEFPDATILAISGGAARGPEGTLTDALLLGADAILAKPFTIEELIHRVQELLAR